MIIYLNTIDSRNLGLIPTTIDIPSPSPKLYYVNIPGRNGKLDVTSYMGDVKFENLDITVEFETMEINTTSVRKLMNAYNGTDVKIGVYEGLQLENYTGRCKKYSVKRTGATCHVTMTIDASPEVEYVAN